MQALSIQCVQRYGVWGITRAKVWKHNAGLLVTNPEFQSDVMLPYSVYEQCVDRVSNFLA